jgi:hypothetical protein
MGDAPVHLTRRLLINQALGLLRQRLDQMGQLPTTDRLAVLAAIANVAHCLSLREVIQDEHNQGHEFYPDQMHIIMSRISVDQIIQAYLDGDRSEDLILRHVQQAMGG